MTDCPILVLGSTGKTGRRIVQRLQTLGLSVREGSRRAPIPFDWEDASTWGATLAGCRRVYISFFPDLAVPGAVQAIERLVQLSREASVERLVLLSGRGEQNAESCEEIVRRSGLEFTLIRASWFAQNFDEGHLLEPVRQGLLAFPAGEVREPFVDVDDIAEVATAALTEDRHLGRLYEVTGPRLLTFAEAARELSMAAGHEVRYQSVTLDEFHTGTAEACGSDFADFLTELCREVLDGRNARLGHGVQEALGREPRDFSDYAARVANSGVWGLQAETPSSS